MAPPAIGAAVNHRIGLVTEEEIRRLVALLAVPSVSAAPEHAGDVARAAELVAEEVRRAGGSAEVRPGARHPLVVGEVPATRGPGAAAVLIYGHYDVQPPGDLALWETPPFEPTVRGGRLLARGACDDKGGLFMLLAAVRRLAEAGRLGVRVRVLVDGEEESGGISAEDWIAADPELPGVRAALVFDAPMLGPRRPALYVGVRGIVSLRVTVRTAAGDAHSGLYGGAALGAPAALARVLAAVGPREGRPPEPLLRGAAPLSAEERAAWEELPPGGRVLAAAGLAPADAAAAAEFYLRTTALPSVDVHALACGDPGTPATVIPARATATLSLRLAPGQRGEEMAATLEALLRDAAPPGAAVEVERLGIAEPALVDPAQPVIRLARDAIERETGWRPVPVRSGGSLPVVAALAARGVPVVLSGFYLPGDGIHAPNEGIDLEHLDVGTRAAAAILEALAPA